MTATPVEVECTVPEAIRALRVLGPVVALESTLPSNELGRDAFVASEPLFQMSLHAGSWRVDGLEPWASMAREKLKTEANPFRALERAIEVLPSPGTSTSGPPIGAFGFFGYECTTSEPTSGVPSAWFLMADCVLHWKHGASLPNLWSCRPEAAQRILTALKNKNHNIPAAHAASSPAETNDSGEPRDLDFEQFREVYETLRERLRRGDSYQLCYTYPIRRRYAADPMLLYEALRESNPAPFASYLQAQDFAIVSCSPERFLKVDAQGHVEARPMKGTAAKSADALENAKARQELKDSVKNRAENLMIADLLRNDLGRVCKLGSVRVTEPAAVEEYATVYQLVSCVEGDLRSDRKRSDLLASAFPPGSMTGAPKVRSVEILRSVEAGPRGPYSGVLGYFGADGRMDWSVLIRCCVLQQGMASCGVGGGIVWDSSAKEEFAETRIKARALLNALERVQGQTQGRVQ